MRAAIEPMLLEPDYLGTINSVASLGFIGLATNRASRWNREGVFRVMSLHPHFRLFVPFGDLWNMGRAMIRLRKYFQVIVVWQLIIAMVCGARI